MTTPLDVVKTLLNTQQHQVDGMVSAFKAVYRLGGAGGYFRGMQARILYQMPSTAICWSTYEFFKFILTKDKAEKAERELAAKLPSMLLPEVNLEADKTRRGDRTVDKFEWSPSVFAPNPAITAVSFNEVYSESGRRGRSS